MAMHSRCTAAGPGGFGASPACKPTEWLPLYHVLLIHRASPPTTFSSRCSNVAEFNRGDLFVIRYRAVQQLLAEGAVELV